MRALRRRSGDGAGGGRVATATGAVLVRDAPEPEPGPGEVLLRTIAAGVSGLDARRAAGDASCEDGAGEVGGSLTLGHEFVAAVESVGPAMGTRADEHAGKLLGCRVVGSPIVPCRSCELCRGGLSAHCPTRRVLGVSGLDGCLAERFVLPAANLVRVPEGVDDLAAVLAAPLASAIHASRQVRLEAKPYVTVLGDGLTALLCAQVMNRLNASVRLIGWNADRLALCDRWAIRNRSVHAVGLRADQDVVVDCSGRADGLAVAARMLRPRGTVVLKSPDVVVPSFATGERRLDAAGDRSDDDRLDGPSPAQLIIAKELSVVGSVGGSQADAVLALGRSDVETSALVTKRLKLDDAERALAAARASDETGDVRVVVEP